MADEKDNKDTQVPEENVKPSDSNISPIDKADSILKALQEQNQRFEENLRRQEEITAKTMLSGRSGVHTEQQHKEESPQDYAKRVVAGQLNDKRD